MHLHSFPVLFVADTDTDSLWAPARCIGDASLPCCPGPMVATTCFAHLRQHREFTLETQARFGMLTQGRISEDMLDACPITTPSLDSTFHTLYRGGKPRLLWSRQPWLLPAANISRGSYQGIHHLTQAFEGEEAKMQNPVVRLSLSVDSGLAQCELLMCISSWQQMGRGVWNRASQQWESEQPEQMGRDQGL